MSPRPSRRRPSPRRRPALAQPRDGIGEVLQLSVGEPAHGGACVARDESGRVVFVRHAAPGEVVRARVTAVQKKLAWADVVEVVEASPIGSPPCGPRPVREASVAESSRTSRPPLSATGSPG